MFINDVVKRTGLTKKAIRFYEDKGLLSVQRQINGYRSYSEDNILTLKKIKMLPKYLHFPETAVWQRTPLV